MYQAAVSVAVIGSLGLWLSFCGPASSTIGLKVQHPQEGSPLVALHLAGSESSGFSRDWGLGVFEARFLEVMALEKKWEVQWQAVESLSQAEDLLQAGRAHLFVSMGEFVDFQELVPTQVYRRTQFTRLCPSEVVLETEQCPLLDVLKVKEIRRLDPHSWVEDSWQRGTVSWWVSKDSEILSDLNEWLSLRGHFVRRQLENKHLQGFVEFEVFESLKFLERMETRLSRYRDLFESAAKDTPFDWKWLAALSYQESHWNPDAVSPTGVRGLMMLTSATAKEVGVSDRKDPRQSIFGAARYLVYLYNLLPGYLNEEDRLFFALAAYNVGLAHLKDAIALTVVDGGDPRDWQEVMNHLPKLSDPRYYKTTRYGYARGKEPVSFVNRIRNYYDILTHVIDKESSLVASSNSFLKLSIQRTRGVRTSEEGR